MGDVVPFIAKVRASGDWTAAERGRLEELAERLSAAGGARVETVFGATDAGDPWCVVTDENGDVLIHVARIGGRFVVHSAVDDALSEDADLHAALRERLNSQFDAEEDAGVVVPFSLGGRQAQTFLALVIATAFFYETVEFADAAEAAPAPPAEAPVTDPPPPPPDVKTPTQERELAVQGAAMTGPVRPASTALAPAAERQTEASVAETVAAPDATEAPPLASAPAAPAPAASAAPLELAQVIVGTAGDDRLTGSAADERLVGGDGDDTLAGGGGADTLDGGAGDDRIELAPQVLAIGGEGADTFVVQAPVEAGRADTLLGVVLDFNWNEGDRLVIGSSEQPIELKPTPPTLGPSGGDSNVDRGGPPTNEPGSTDFGPTTTSPDTGTRVDVDVDGDGVIDGYVLVYVTRVGAVMMDPLGLVTAFDVDPTSIFGPGDLFG